MRTLSTYGNAQANGFCSIGFCNWKLIYFSFFFVVTLLDSRSVQGELGWIASPLEGGVSSEWLSAPKGKKGVISNFLKVLMA